MLAFHTQLCGTCCHPTCSTEFHMEMDGNGFIQYTQNICLTLSKHEEQEVFHWYPISWTPCQPYHYGIASKTSTCHTSNNDVSSSLNIYIYMICIQVPTNYIISTETGHVRASPTLRHTHIVFLDTYKYSFEICFSWLNTPPRFVG